MADDVLSKRQYVPKMCALFYLLPFQSVHFWTFACLDQITELSVLLVGMQKSFTHTERPKISCYLFLIVPAKMQEQGLSGYSSAPLTSSARPRLGKCRLSWVWHGSGYFRLSACLGRSSHRHASSGFVSVQTRLTAQSWHDHVRTSVFLDSLSHAVLVRSLSYTPQAGFIEEFLLHSSC